MTELEHLVDDLGLIPLSSLEAQSVISAFAIRDRFLQMDFEDDLRDFESVRSPDLLEMYYKYNRKGCKRSFGSSFDLQLKLF